MLLVTREQWGALPSDGSAAQFLPRLRNLCLHYTGVSARPDPLTDAEKVAYLHNLQRIYQTGGRGDGQKYVDVAYNFAVFASDPRVWELRGMRMRGGANGDTATNADEPSCLIVIDVGEFLTPPAIVGVRSLVKWVRDNYGTHVGIIGHRDRFNTACPSDHVYTEIQRGTFEPGTVVVPPIEPPTNGDNEMLAWRDPRFHNVFVSTTGMPVADGEVSAFQVVTNPAPHSPKLEAICRINWGMDTAQAVLTGRLVPDPSWQG